MGARGNDLPRTGRRRLELVPAALVAAVLLVHLVGYGGTLLPGPTLGADLGSAGLRVQVVPTVLLVLLVVLWARRARRPSS